VYVCVSLSRPLGRHLGFLLLLLPRSHGIFHWLVPRSHFTCFHLAIAAIWPSTC
jgi:hypothetical protein